MNKKGVLKEETGEWEGVINYINQDKGFGFIGHSDYPEGLFFHARDVGEDTAFEYLKKGEIVKFGKIFETDKGMSAGEVSAAA